MTIKILQKNNNLETHVRGLETHIRGQFLSYKMVKYDKNFNFIQHIVLGKPTVFRTFPFNKEGGGKGECSSP